MAKNDIKKSAENTATSILGRTRKLMESAVAITDTEVDEARRDSEHTDYTSVDRLGKATEDEKKITKIIATLKSYDSQRYTKLGRNLLRIQQLEDEIKGLKAEIKGMDKELVADLFDASDAVYTREVDTVGFLFKLTKDPAPSVTYKREAVLEALQEHFTPELQRMYEELMEKFKTTTQKSPGLSATDKAPALAQAAESVEINEGIIDTLKAYISKFKALVHKWAASYDKRFAALKAQVSFAESEEVNVTDEDLSEAVVALKNRIAVLESQLAEYGQSFSYSATPAVKSVIADVKPEEVKIMTALWCYEGSSDKIWAIAQCRGKYISVWGKRNGNQATGQRNWQYQLKSYPELAGKIGEKHRKGYDTIISNDHIIPGVWAGGSGILNFVKAVAARVFNSEELKAAMRGSDDHMVARGGAMESLGEAFQNDIVAYDKDTGKKLKTFKKGQDAAAKKYQREEGSKVGLMDAERFKEEIGECKESKKKVTEAFKNTYDKGDRVDTPCGPGTIVELDPQININGKVKVKLDDPSQAGEDGKYQDTFTFTANMLKHI